MDEAQSVGLGLVLGVVVIFILSIFPGEPFDYTKHDLGASNKTVICPESVGDDLLDQLDGDSSRTDTLCCVSALQASERIVDSSSSSSARERLKRRKEVEKAAQEVKIHKLQELLGIETSKMAELLERAKADAIKGTDLHASSSVTNYSSYLDVCFYATALSLLALVLKVEYSINPLHVVAYLFPREAETAHKLLAAPFQYVSQLVG
uniref:Uncharacterized protein n=1 Tax=Globisporangium ultimum (strain ATCC 200006 / CBS 805.95 / DAOM BR144) TaxID=431595 RepID=K3WFE5_GLOUD